VGRFVEDTGAKMLEILIGIALLVMALMPKAKFYPGRLGTKQKLPPIEPSWIPRLFIFAAGLAVAADGIARVRQGGWLTL
jgi:hypothetical protein